MGLALNLLKLGVGLVSVFWLGLAGAFLEFKWEHRPAGWPNYVVGRCPFCLTLHAKDGPYARLAARELADRAAAQHAAQVETAQTRVAAGGQVLEVKAQAAIRAQAQTLAVEIPHVVTPRLDADYPLSVGFVRAHDAAALGRDLSEIPAPFGEPDGARSSVAPSAALEVMGANYADCRADAEQLTRLQAEWMADYAAQAQATPPAK